MRRYAPIRTRPQRDPVTSELHAYVLSRDGECMAARLNFPHECRDRFGQPHGPRDVGRLTVEHVTDHAAMGRRAESDARHLVALCFSRNVAVPSKAMREAFRAYLAHVEPVA